MFLRRIRGRVYNRKFLFPWSHWFVAQVGQPLGLRGLAGSVGPLEHDEPTGHAAAVSRRRPDLSDQVASRPAMMMMMPASHNVSRALGVSSCTG